MASKTKHYTSVENKIFLDILKDYKDINETKKSDSSTLRDKVAAWTEICCKYNNSFQINDQVPRAEIDPDVAIIAPHLMQLAPSSFTSNNPAEHQNDDQLEVSGGKDDNGEIEFYDVTLLEDLDIVEADAGASQGSLLGTSSSSSQGTNSESPTPLRKKVLVAEKRNRTCTESSSRSSDERLREDAARLLRITGLRQHDEEIFKIRKEHTLRVGKIEECHLNVMNQVREEHLLKINELEIRKATAEAELAELKLARERAGI